MTYPAKCTFPCRSPIGVRDNDCMVVAQSAQGVSIYFLSDANPSASIFLSPEDALRFAQVILETADATASDPID